MADLPCEVYDTVYLDLPMPTAVSRVLLRPWVQKPHPDSKHAVFCQTPLPRCMVDSLAWVTAEAPTYAHGLLIHAVQKTSRHKPMPPVVQTIRQYATSKTVLGCKALSLEPHGVPEHVIIFDRQVMRMRPSWLLTALASQLLYPASIVGTPPETP